MMLCSHFTSISSQILKRALFGFWAVLGRLGQGETSFRKTCVRYSIELRLVVFEINKLGFTELFRCLLLQHAWHFVLF